MENVFSAMPFSWDKVMVMGMLALPLSCSPDPSFNKAPNTRDTNHAPIVRSASVMPSPLTLAGPVFVHVDAEDEEGHEITLNYRWIVNGLLLPDEKSPTLSPQFLKKGDSVIVEISAADGRGDASVFVTDPAIVVNTAPILKEVTLEIQSSGDKARLMAKVNANDPDGDEINYSYRWWHNDQLIKEGTENLLSNVPLIRSDVYLVEVTAQDQDGEGIPIKSLPFTIGNTSPEIISQPAATFSPPLYSYKINAKDADDDPLLYSLEIAPPGMTIDNSSGEIKWDVPSGLSGTHRVKVIVDDGRGGTSSQEFELKIAQAGA